MKLKWKLLPLAFAAVGFVGCTNEIEGGQENVSEQNGSTTYMTVSINSELTTRADNPAEDGNGDPEVGLDTEYNVKNVTVVLYTDYDGKGTTAPESFKKDSKLVGAGFASISGGTSGSAEPGHSREATVTVKITDPTVEFDGKTYGVIAVTNLTDSKSLADRIKADDIDTGEELANYLQKEHETNGVGFVMSSHLPKAETVTLKAGATATDAPVANVHVERLAAKIRITEANTESLTSFFYAVKDRNSTEVAKVRLDQVAIVNQLESGSYLLKRVSDDATSANIAIPSVDNDTYLGDEKYVSQTQTQTQTVTANYVIDPWTRNKDGNNIKNITNISATDNSTKLGYAQSFSGTSYTEMFNGFNTKIDLATNSKLTDAPDDKIDLAYTLENTVSAEYSYKGYITGAIYKATYFPKEWMVANSSNNGVEIGSPKFGESSNIEYANVDETTKGVTFYSYQGVIYKDFQAIFVDEYSKFLQESNGITYDDFTTKIASLSIDKFMKSSIANAPDPLGYLQYLKNLAGPGSNGSWTGNFTTENSFTNYCVKNFETNKVALLKNVNRYSDGVNYYEYWIRHEDNSDKTHTGIMEFGIVRNNIYDMKVTGISGLGNSGDETPDPENPGETDDLLFTVNLYVKDWIVRSNDGIIL